MVAAETLLPGLGAFLARQRWFAGDAAPRTLSVQHAAVEHEGRPGLLSMILDAGGACYHVPVGLRPLEPLAEFLHGRQEAIVGELEVDGETLLAYDAALDPELALTLLDVVTRGAEKAERVRPVTGEQTNSSLIYDERLILKLFRRLHPGPNPEIEVTGALDEVGFDHVAAPLASWSHHDDERWDLAVVQPYLAGGVDGWALALTSLRDLFGVSDTQQIPVVKLTDEPPVTDPAEAGGDFSAEARRLGEITAELHRALARAFGQGPGDPDGWARGMEVQLERVDHPELDRRRILDVFAEVRRVSDPGPSIRVHGDYHLGQVMRTDAGWYVLDFEGEPALPLAERRQPSSPLRDVAGMLRSFHYASLSATTERDETVRGLAARWETYNRRAFLEGYLAKATGDVLPPDPTAFEVLVRGFELQKAVYEVGYEQSYRPSWIGIPLAAVRRLTGATP